MKILLVAPVKDNPAGLAQFPPLGLGYLASALRKAGYPEVKILDCVLEGLDIRGFEERVSEMRPDLVGVTLWSLSVREVEKTLAAVKAVDHRITTVIGGPHPSALGAPVMEHFKDADYGFKGEAEIGLPMLADLLSGKSKARPVEIPGLMWRDGGVRENPMVFVDDLDSLCMPAWDLIEPWRYALTGTLVRKRTACIITTRGCPFPCTFCSASITAGKKLRRRSIGDVMDEIRLLYGRYGIRRFVVFDENITLNHSHIRGFCERVIEEGLDISFELPNGIRLDTLTLDILLLMRRAGFSERVAVGIESGSERILRLMKKGLTKDGIREKVGLLKKAGFRPIGYFIIGFPTETMEDIEETLRFALELKLYRAGFMPFHPLPGTESFGMLAGSGEISEGFDWSVLSTDSIAYAPKGMTKEELESARKRAILRFNMRPRVLWDYMRDYNSFVFALKKLRSVFLVRRSDNGRLGEAA